MLPQDDEHFRVLTEWAQAVVDWKVGEEQGPAPGRREVATPSTQAQAARLARLPARFRWSNRVRKKVTSKKGKTRKIILLVPVEKQIMDLVRAGIGRRISRTENYSFRTFPSAIALPRG